LNPVIHLFRPGAVSLSPPEVKKSRHRTVPTSIIVVIVVILLAIGAIGLRSHRQSVIERYETSALDAVRVLNASDTDRLEILLPPGVPSNARVLLPAGVPSNARVLLPAGVPSNARVLFPPEDLSSEKHPFFEGEPPESSADHTPTTASMMSVIVGECVALDIRRVRLQARLVTPESRNART